MNRRKFRMKREPPQQPESEKNPGVRPLFIQTNCIGLID